MTTPGGSAPDGAWVVGSSYGSDVTEESARNAVKQSPISAWEIAQDAWKYACQEQRKTAADLRDGQNALKHRLDLLDEVDGYGAAVMGFNWMIPYSRWVVLPFETQLGPAKSVEVSTDGPDSGFLTLKKGGLWRVDTHITITGYTVYYVYVGGAAGWLPYYDPIFPKVMLEVVDSSGGLVTAREFHMVSDLTQSQGVFATDINAPRSAAFSHTFVVDSMLPEDDPAAVDDWVKVRVSIQYVNPGYSGVFDATTCQVLGGTARSALTATRWSRDVSSLSDVSVVPDGGDLG